MRIILPEIEERKPTWIDIWYNRSARSWVAELKDDEFMSIGDSEYGSKEWMKKIFAIWVRDYKLDENHIKEMQKKQKNRLKNL